eukprot:7391427-Prymnesium_polylepis.2
MRNFNFHDFNFKYEVDSITSLATPRDNTKKPDGPWPGLRLRLACCLVVHRHAPSALLPGVLLPHAPVARHTMTDVITTIRPESRSCCRAP